VIINPQPTNLPLIIGHRGASRVAPENTHIAFERAMRDGADGIEFDVRLSSDGIPVCIHDADLRRTGEHTAAVGDLTAHQLTHHTVGAWFNKKFPAQACEDFNHQTILTLDQTLEWARTSGALLYPELKVEAGNAYPLAAQVGRLIARHSLLARVVVESFDLSAVRAVRQVHAGIRTAALYDNAARTHLPVHKYIVTSARDNGASEVALHYTLATPKVVSYACDAGLDVIVWTVDDTVWAERAVARGIKAVITNDPATMRHAIAARRA